MKTMIDKRLQVIGKALDWSPNVPEAERLQFRQQLINIRRGLNKVRYAVEEHCSAAAFGESQMGKSYLVSAMLSKPGEAFCVTDTSTGAKYNFINEINPSAPGSTVEATGLVTRFTAGNDDRDIPAGYLKIRLLTVVDLILILSEAYYTQVVDYDNSRILRTSDINERLQAIQLGDMREKAFLCEDDILDIEEYMRSLLMYNRAILNIVDSEYFTFLLKNVRKMSEEQTLEVVTFLWDGNEDISRLFKDLVNAYREVDFSECVYVPFKSVLRKHGTMLDVARLNEMYCKPENEPSEYIPTTDVRTGKGLNIQTRKSFLSALSAELYFVLPENVVEEHPFLKDLDILDFPGARRPEKIKAAALADGNNLPTVFRRGKVSYLFNKYSAAKRINSLMFCHNNNQSAESTMSYTLNNWVAGNLGETPQEREMIIQRAKVSPLFIISTWFNKDLVYHDEIKDRSDLDERWRRRFNTVLEGEVLKSLDDEGHWFNNWTPRKCFDNIFMLRDFKFSKEFYSGYHPGPENRSPEREPIVNAAYPDFMLDLKESFCKDEFVGRHFEDPQRAWDDAASINMDGTRRIIDALNVIAPNLNDARRAKFEADIVSLNDKLMSLLGNYYHTRDISEEIRKAKKQARKANMQIDARLGQDPFFFGRFMDALMLDESKVHELVHELLVNYKVQPKMSGKESQIFMSAGLSSDNSRKENEELLIDYTGSDTLEECRQSLEEIGVDINSLLATTRMQVGAAESVVDAVEDYWFNETLSHYAVAMFKDEVDSVSGIVSTLFRLYRQLGVKAEWVGKVDGYIQDYGTEGSVEVVSDYLSMMFNRLSASFGYDYFDAAGRRSVAEKNQRFRLQLNENLLEDGKEGASIDLVADLETQKSILQHNAFKTDDKEFLNRFPQYNSVWKWEERMKAGYAFSCDLPDFDPVANEELGKILNDIKE